MKTTNICTVRASAHTRAASVWELKRKRLAAVVAVKIRQHILHTKYIFISFLFCFFFFLLFNSSEHTRASAIFVSPSSSTYTSAHTDSALPAQTHTLSSFCFFFTLGCAGHSTNSILFILFSFQSWQWNRRENTSREWNTIFCRRKNKKKTKPIKKNRQEKEEGVRASSVRNLHWSVARKECVASSGIQ